MEYGLIKLSPEKRKKLAECVCAEIEASDAAKGGLPDRWKKNQAIYDVEPGVTNLDLIEGLPSYNLPIVRQKAERINGSVYDAITSLDPYVQALPDSGGHQDAVERDLMAIAEKSDFNGRFKRSLIDAFVANAGFMYVCPVQGKEEVEEVLDLEIDPETGDMSPVMGSRLPVAGLKWKWVSPHDMVIFPTKDTSLEEAKTVGHKYSKLLYRVKADIKSGRYYNVKLESDNQPHRYSPNDKRGEDQPPEPEDGTIQLAELITETDVVTGKYARYLVTVAVAQREILRVEEFPDEYGEPWYVDFRYLEGDGCVWDNTSLAQVCQGNQVLYNDIATTLVQGAFASAFPINVVSGAGLANKVQRVRPGSLVEYNGSEIKVQSLGVQFNGAYLAPLLELVQSNTDSLVGINRLGEGENLPASTKATAIDALMAAQNESKDMRLDNIVGSVARCFKLMFRMYRAHYDDFKRSFGERLTATYDDLTQEPTFAVTGQSGASNSRLLLGKLQAIQELAANPNLIVDQQELARKIVQAMDLPFETKTILLDLDASDLLAYFQAIGGGLPPAVAIAGIRQMRDGNAQESGGTMAQRGPDVALDSAGFAGQATDPAASVGGIPTGEGAGVPGAFAGT